MRSSRRVRSRTLRIWNWLNRPGTSRQSPSLSRKPNELGAGIERRENLRRGRLTIERWLLLLLGTPATLKPLDTSVLQLDNIRSSNHWPFRPGGPILFASRETHYLFLPLRRRSSEQSRVRERTQGHRGYFQRHRRSPA